MEILTYQGNKKKLINFIEKHIEGYLSNEKALVDIFCGGCSITNHFSKKYPVISNDLEPFAYVIASSTVLKANHQPFEQDFLVSFSRKYSEHYNRLSSSYGALIMEEQSIIENKLDSAVEFYKKVPTLWNNGFSPFLKVYLDASQSFLYEEEYCLFVSLYSNNYFGLLQAIQIDCIKYAISQVKNHFNLYYLYACLFYAMNQCVFSKDGHMAQPLSIEKNLPRLFNLRSKNLLKIFEKCFSQYESIISVNSKINKTYNQDFLSLINEINPSEIGCIYADPPYTDMQYSRYYHLLNTVYLYKFSEPTQRKGVYSKGLYLNKRNQSNISKHSLFIEEFSKLIDFSSKNNLPLAISFAYPKQDSDEATNRYLISIEEMHNLASKYYGEKNVKVYGQDFLHSNQRKSSRKKVVEYLIVCERL